jgi:uncharacterized protein (DUF1330 family)
MPAYVITEMKISDPERYKAYQALTPEAIRAAGGRFLSRGGAISVLEGNWRPDRLVIVEFDTTAAAQAFYDSARYRQACEARAGATEIFNMVVVEGT